MNDTMWKGNHLQGEQEQVFESPVKKPHFSGHVSAALLPAQTSGHKKTIQDTSLISHRTINTEQRK